MNKRHDSISEETLNLHGDCLTETDWQDLSKLYLWPKGFQRFMGLEFLHHVLISGYRTLNKL